MVKIKLFEKYLYIRRKDELEAEKVIHIISASLHILAAVTWIGSMIYNQFAVVPALNKSLGSPKTHAVGGLIMKNFSPLTWISLIVLIGTGIYAAADKSDKFKSWTNGPGGVLTLKLVLVGIMIIILLMQTFFYGPKMKQLIAPSTTKSTKNDAEMMEVEKTTKPMSWWHMSLGIVVIILAVILSGLLD